MASSGIYLLPLIGVNILFYHENHSQKSMAGYDAVGAQRAVPPVRMRFPLKAGIQAPRFLLSQERPGVANLKISKCRGELTSPFMSLRAQRSNLTAPFYLQAHRDCFVVLPMEGRRSKDMFDEKKKVPRQRGTQYQF